MNFEQLGLNKALLKAIEALQYSCPTPIQEKAIPLLLEGKDLIGSAQTGTGKTAAFALPILHRIAANRLTVRGQKRSICALILTPTRELAWQIFECFQTYGRYLNSRYAVVYGGVSSRPQIQAIQRGIDVLIATPGRLLDLMKQKVVVLDDLEICVLDEADRMLDMGFITDIKKIIKQTPSQRQTVLFSATISPDILRLSKGLLHQPKSVSVAPQNATADPIHQSVYMVDAMQKNNLLRYLIKQKKIVSALVFTKTKRGAERLSNQLQKEGIAAQALHGDKSQMERQRALRDFKNGKSTVLVATDVAARGIDMSSLSYVFNYDIPEFAENYIHRIGRTGRAGKAGRAIALCCPGEKRSLEEIEKRIGKSIHVVTEHPYASAASKLEVHPKEKRRRQPQRNGTVSSPKTTRTRAKKQTKKEYRTLDEWFQDHQEYQHIVLPNKDGPLDGARRDVGIALLQTEKRGRKRMKNL